jgi:hypothetical protein
MARSRTTPIPDRLPPPPRALPQQAAGNTAERAKTSGRTTVQETRQSVS